MQCLLFAAILAAALGSGLIGGLFFAFSSFVMKALGRLPPAKGIAAMQEINVVVLNPLFFAAFSTGGAASGSGSATAAAFGSGFGSGFGTFTTFGVTISTLGGSATGFAA